MRVLGIETSCDETAAAVVESESGVCAEGRHLRLVANVISSQIGVHRPFGGVVPEVASREHLVRLVDVIRLSAQERGVDPHTPLSGIDAIAVTQGPGLLGALLVGLQAAKGLAWGHNIAWLGVHHLEGHLAAAHLAPKLPGAQHIAFIVSGGHTHLFVRRGPFDLSLVGATRDDAAGEAFDKVAKLLGLGYPGGPAVEQEAQHGDPRAFALPRALPNEDDLSFSGLKTAVHHVLRKHNAPLSAQMRADLCASVQQAIADVLAQKAVRAAKQHHMPGIVLAGGVAANRCVRHEAERAAKEQGLWVFCPPAALCTDNAAMIAAAGIARLSRGERSDWRDSARSRWPLASVAHVRAAS